MRSAHARSEHAAAGVADDLNDEPALGEDVEVSDDLPDHEDGLRPRSLLVPHALRDLERRAALGFDRSGDELEPLFVELDSLLDQQPVSISGQWPEQKHVSSIATVRGAPRGIAGAPVADAPQGLSGTSAPR